MNKLCGAVPVNRTKLYRPPVTVDYVPRDTLDDRLEARVSLPLTVVSAPAGYGKTTIISHWLESSDYLSTWLSLDESDNDIRCFLTYVVASLQTVSTDACQETLNNINADSLPPMSIIATDLSNDLDALEEPLILVLDDYHLIREFEIHRLLECILEHPPQHLHLVIVSRHDPALSLVSLRACHRLNEIRMYDLEFSKEDTLALLEKISGKSLQAINIERLQNSIEGWAAGIRLVALALQYQDNVEKFLSHFENSTQPLHEYMITEVLSAQSPGIQESLLSISVLERFNYSLCEALCNSDDKVEGVNGKDFIETLEKSGLFYIRLDEQCNWYRFHHIFSALLKQQLEVRRCQEDISELHKKASVWFTDNGYIEEAIHHALEGNDDERAVLIIGHARHDLMNNDQWHRLERWLNLFSHIAVQQHIHLILLRCWLDLYHWYRLDYLVKDLERAETLLEISPLDAHELAPLEAEVAAIRSNLAYWILKPSHGITLVEQVLRDSPDKHECIRSTALLGWSPLCQMLGDVHQGDSVLWEHMEDGRFNSPSSRSRLIQSLCLTYWPEADTRKLLQAASRLLELSTKHDLLWSQSFARYFLGLMHYERNELKEAVAQLEIITEDSYHFPIQNLVHCSFLLSLSYQVLGLSERAREIADSISKLTFERGNKMFIDLAEAFQANLDLRQGRIVQANQWARAFKMPAPHGLQRFFNAELTFISVMMAQNTPQSRKITAEQLNNFHGLLNQIHHPRLLIDVLGMKALLADSEGDSDTAVALLHEAVVIGQPGQLIRPLADLGPDLIKLLNRLNLNEEGLHYIGKILSALGKSTGMFAAVTNDYPLSETLSQRELEILNLFARNLSNKAIAEKLFISTGTVKRHAHNIYSKLSVSGRRNAVSKATGLGILK